MNDGPEDFWRFVVLRQTAYWRHERGDGPPYSDDPAIARFHFCNVYREADRGSRWFQAHRTARGSLAAALMDSVAFRPLNKVDTFRDGIPRAQEWPAWVASLRARQAGGERVFTGRHFVKTLGMYEAALEQLAFWADRIVDAVGACGSLREVTEVAKWLRGVGDFFSWQIACDLLESDGADRRAGVPGWFSETVRLDQHEWALLGPGARAGARRVDPQADPLDTARRLVDGQPRDGSLAPPPEAPGPMSLKNIEHALCEYERWCKASRGPARLETKPWAKEVRH